MTGYHADSRTGRVVAGVVDTVWTPRTPRAGYGVILCHGAGNPNGYMDLVTQPAATRLAAAIASRGVPCVSGDFGGDLWGRDDQLTHMDTARSVLAAAHPSMAADRVLLLGVSHGGSMAVRYAIERPGQVAGVVGVIPALDVVWLWENVAELRASVGAAYGVTYPAALPSDADTLDRAGELVGVPQLFGYSSVDPVTPPTNVTRFAAASGGTAYVIDSSDGHSDAAVAKMPVADVLNFLLANGA